MRQSMDAANISEQHLIRILFPDLENIIAVVPLDGIQAIGFQFLKDQGEEVSVSPISMVEELIALLLDRFGDPLPTR